MKNNGKKFEDDIKKSVPNYAWIYRLKDGSANIGINSLNKNSKVRFQCHNISDFILMGKKYLFILELKSHKGKSIPFCCIRNTQISEMEKIKHKKIKCYFLFNFIDLRKTYAIESYKIAKFIKTSNRKSFPYNWCNLNGIKINSQIKRTRFTYDIDTFLTTVEV